MTLVLWDIDGTLIDGAGTARQAYAAAFHRATGGRLTEPWRFDGRTELAAATEVLRAHGFRPEALLTTFLDLIVAELTDRSAELAAQGRVLPGAAEALAAVGSLPGVRQTVLTGNLYPLALLKLRVFGLIEHVDARIGAYGGDALERTDLPAHAFRRARRYLGEVFDGGRTVLVGDTVRDVRTAQAAGIRCVAVATGTADPAALSAAGADVVLPDLVDTQRVLAAITP